MPGPGSIACPKPGPIARGKARKKRAQWKRNRVTREYIFGRERERCRCCRFRRAETMHEIIPRSLRGKVSASNSIAVCGDGVRGCHGFCQRYEIAVEPTDPLWAESTLTFTPTTRAAAEWMRVAQGQTVESPVMVSVEAEL